MFAGLSLKVLHLLKKLGALDGVGDSLYGAAAGGQLLAQPADHSLRCGLLLVRGGSFT